MGTPFEWKNKSRLVLVSYLKLRSKITKYGVACDQVIAGKEDEKVFSELYAGFWFRVIEDALAITRAIELLSEEEINTHKSQTKKLTDLFHQFGWDNQPV